MKIAIAPDSFKGSLTASQAAACMERGLRRALGNIETVRVPMADGGGGTVRAVVEATGGRLVARRVRDPLGRPVTAHFGVSGDGRAAVIEMAEASGLVRLRPRERNPLVTSSAGTGDLIRHALGLGVRRILIGIGGSATNDGGMGMARALGARFKDRRGRELPEGGGSLCRLWSVDLTNLTSALRGVAIEVACDVDNPLFGRRGAAFVYAPQKGASPRMVRDLDRGLRRLAGVIRRDLGMVVDRMPGAGAAGGLGAGLTAFLGARLQPGVQIVSDLVRLEDRLRGCDLVITGEGRMDGQTVYGKTAAGVARAARRLGIPAIAICGSLGAGVRRVHGIGIAAYISALQEPMDEAALSARAAPMLVDCAEQVGRLLALGIC
jgi:glycerate kinase